MTITPAQARRKIVDMVGIHIDTAMECQFHADISIEPDVVVAHIGSRAIRIRFSSGDDSHKAEWTVGTAELPEGATASDVTTWDDGTAEMSLPDTDGLITGWALAALAHATNQCAAEAADWLVLDARTVLAIGADEDVEDMVSEAHWLQRQLEDHPEAVYAGIDSFYSGVDDSQWCRILPGGRGALATLTLAHHLGVPTLGVDVYSYNHMWRLDDSDWDTPDWTEAETARVAAAVDALTADGRI